MNVLPFDKQTTIIHCLCEGMSIRATARVVGVHRDTVMRLGLNVGEGCFRLHDRLFVNLTPEFLELDEIWSFIFKKQKRLVKGDPKEYGDQYTYIAIDADGKAIISYLTGKRNGATTASFALDLKRRILTDPQISSDGYEPYVKAIKRAFGSSIDYAQLIKMYAADCGVEAKRRYSAADVVDAEKRIIYGDPDKDRISTSYVERQNLTVRMLTRRFTRLTNGFSKVLRNHAASIDLYVCYYNFCRVHETIKTTPAIAVGVTDHVWTIEELIGEALPLSDPNDPPVRYGSQRFQETTCKRGVCNTGMVA